MIFQELAKEVCRRFADRLIHQRQRRAGHLQNALGVFDAEARELGRFFDTRFAAGFLQDVALGVANAAEAVDHVDRQTDRPALVGMARVIAWRIHHVA